MASVLGGRYFLQSPQLAVGICDTAHADGDYAARALGPPEPASRALQRPSDPSRTLSACVLARSRTKAGRGACAQICQRLSPREQRSAPRRSTMRMSTAHGIQGETGMFSASDLADWFDDGEEQFWRQQDDWLIEQQDLGNAHPVLVFAAWFSDRAASAPQRGLHSLSAGVVDVLRLGSDIDPSDSAFNIGKGVFANVTRLLTLAGPIAEGLGVGARYAGLMAETQLTKLRGVPGPCRFVSLDRALTFARGKKVQLFAALDDVAKVR